MDIATIVGVIAGFTFILVSMGKNLPAFVNAPSLMIVVGGTVSATLVSYPLQDVINIISVVKKALFAKVVSPSELIEKVVGFAETARREGILALEQAVDEVDDKFLSEGVRLAVDGTEPDLIMDIMETELSFLEERHKLGQDLFRSMGSLSPAFGLIGTLSGLVIMLKNMQDPSAIGPGMALALITTFYGAVMANLIFNPIADKLKTRSNEELLIKRMIIEGIMSIQSGDNPRIVETKLQVFIAPKLRTAAAEE